MTPLPIDEFFSDYQGNHDDHKGPEIDKEKEIELIRDEELQRELT